MGRGPPWTPEEDEAIIKAAAENWKHGRFDPDKPYDARIPTRRLSELAERYGRTEAAFIKRAQRIAARSYRPRDTGEIWDGRAWRRPEVAKPQAAVGAGRGAVAKARRDAGLCMDCGGRAPRSPKYLHNVARRIERETGVPFERLVTYGLCRDCYDKRQAAAAPGRAKRRKEQLRRQAREEAKHEARVLARLRRRDGEGGGAG